MLPSFFFVLSLPCMFHLVSRMPFIDIKRLSSINDRVLVRVGICWLAHQAWTAIGFIFKVSCTIVYIYFFSCKNVLTSNDRKSKIIGVFDGNILDEEFKRTSILNKQNTYFSIEINTLMIYKTDRSKQHSIILWHVAEGGAF